MSLLRWCLKNIWWCQLSVFPSVPYFLGLPDLVFQCMYFVCCDALLWGWDCGPCPSVGIWCCITSRCICSGSPHLPCKLTASLRALPSVSPVHWEELPQWLLCVTSAQSGHSALQWLFCYRSAPFLGEEVLKSRNLGLRVVPDTWQILNRWACQREGAREGERKIDFYWSPEESEQKGAET